MVIGDAKVIVRQKFYISMLVMHLNEERLFSNLSFLFCMIAY